MWERKKDKGRGGRSDAYGRERREKLRGRGDSYWGKEGIREGGWEVALLCHSDVRVRF